VTRADSSPGTLDSGDRSGDTLRLFLALVVPADAAAELERWRDSQLLAGVTSAGGGGGVRPVDGFHITLAFLGSRPHSDLAGIAGALRESAVEAAPFELVPKRYRETRSVGMLVLDDPSGEAGRLAVRLHERLEELGVYEREARRWLPHTTVVRFRERPRLAPSLEPLQAELGTFAPSEAAAFVSRLHPSGARYEILEKCRLGG
jgi:RNA 2',3'-cyclic 3'-phosphodiesterase